MDAPILLHPPRSVGPESNKIYKDLGREEGSMLCSVISWNRSDSEWQVCGGTWPERTQRLRATLVFVDPPMLALFSLPLSLSFLLGVFVLFAPAVVSKLYRVVAILI